MGIAHIWKGRVNLDLLVDNMFEECLIESLHSMESAVFDDLNEGGGVVTSQNQWCDKLIMLTVHIHG